MHDSEKSTDILLLTAADKTGVVKSSDSNPTDWSGHDYNPHFTAGWNFSEINLAVCGKPGQGHFCIYVFRAQEMQSDCVFPLFFFSFWSSLSA